jgi:hypothetical protein
MEIIGWERKREKEKLETWKGVTRGLEQGGQE